MAQEGHQQTPMSSKLTTMLLFLRQDREDGISSAQLVSANVESATSATFTAYFLECNFTGISIYVTFQGDSADAVTEQDQDQSEEAFDVDNEGIILGGDVCNCRKSKCLKL